MLGHILGTRENGESWKSSEIDVIQTLQTVANYIGTWNISILLHLIVRGAMLACIQPQSCLTLGQVMRQQGEWEIMPGNAGNQEENKGKARLTPLLGFPSFMGGCLSCMMSEPFEQL